tara:strand:- start:11310 stop:12296 length:987 start_codon:yes stop_codon:yes gene_type:complete
MNKIIKNPQPKIHAYLAQLGMGSRREIERWIMAEQIQVNGQAAHLGQRVSDKDKIVVRGKLVDTAESKQMLEVIAYHKPEGEICTRGETDLRTVYQSLPKVNGRWISVGRLDVSTSGLLLFTNNGDLAHRLMHPSYEVSRSYRVRVFGKLSETALQNMIKGVRCEDELLKVDSIQPLYLSQDKDKMKNMWYELTLKEGKNREVRRLIESQGAKVSRLIRTHYGPIALMPNLKPGAVEVLNKKQIMELGKVAKLKLFPASYESASSKEDKADKKENTPKIDNRKYKSKVSSKTKKLSQGGMRKVESQERAKDIKTQGRKQSRRKSYFGG